MRHCASRIVNSLRSMMPFLTFLLSFSACVLNQKTEFKFYSYTKYGNLRQKRSRQGCGRPPQGVIGNSPSGLFSTVFALVIYYLRPFMLPVMRPRYKANFIWHAFFLVNNEQTSRPIRVVDTLLAKSCWYFSLKLRRR